MSRVDPLVVVGGGLAGSLLVEALLSRLGEGVTWILDPAAARGSDTPCALVHPFPGRSFEHDDALADQWRASRRWIERLGAQAEVQRAVLRRRVAEGPAGVRLARSYERNLDRLRASFAGTLTFAEHRDPAGRLSWIEYGPVFGLDLAAAVREVHQGLRARGCTPLSIPVVALTRDGARWRLQMHDGSSRSAERVVVAAGAGTRALIEPYVQTEDIEHVEGTLVHARGPAWSEFVVDRGHAASTTGTRAWGSSFRSLDRPDARDPMQQLRDIESRLSSYTPDLPSLETAEHWTGIRVVDRRRRRPWVRRLAPGLWVMTGFGARGVLAIPEAVQTLSRQLIADRS